MIRKDRFEERSNAVVVVEYCKQHACRSFMKKRNKVVETKDVTFFKEHIVKLNSSPKYIELELKDEEGILIDPQQEDGDESNSVELDKIRITKNDK